MIRRICIGAALLSAALPASVLACVQGKGPRPFEAAQQRFRLMLAQGQLDELERWARKSENPAERTSDGQSLHAALISGMTMASRCPASASMDAEQLLAAEGYRARLAEWVARYPGSRSAALASALSPLALAWAARGTGYSDSVDDKAWPIFNENVARARSALEGLSADLRADPAWHVAMLGVMKLQSVPEPEYRRALDEAIARHPDYEWIWFEAGSYYGPKWGGDKLKVRALAERAADATSARLGQTMYTRLQWSSAAGPMFMNGQADWGRMKEGFERIMRDYPDNWNANNFGSFACRAHDPDGLRKAFAHIDKPIPEAWTAILFETCRQHVNDPVAAPSRALNR